MLTLYTLLKFLHVTLAIVAVGFNLTYGVLLTRGAKEGIIGPMLRMVHVLDSRFANPSYVLLLLTGLAMAFYADIPLTTSWLLASLILYAGAAVSGIAFYAPQLRRQMALADAGAAGSDEFAALTKQGAILGALLGVDVLVIVFLMVTKPGLW